MRLIGDITTNHTGDAHQWFTAAISDVRRAEREMFYFDADGDYESWCGVKTLPKLNWGSAELRRRFGWPVGGAGAGCAAVRLDGWRVDVANMTGRLRRRRPTPTRWPALLRAGGVGRGRTRWWSPSTCTTPPATWTATAGTAR